MFKKLFIQFIEYSITVLQSGGKNDLGIIRAVEEGLEKAFKNQKINVDISIELIVDEV